MALVKDNAAFRDVLDRAAELSGEERRRFVDSACGEDEGMRTRVVMLLDALERADGFLEDPTIDAAPGQGRGGMARGARIGNYELIEPIGEGGMGTVFRAKQLRPVRREVALKLIKLGMDTKRVIARFDAERQALAMMDHPSIAKVLDAGATDAGRPYFVMELVRGMRITDYCDQNLLSVERRLELFIHVCNAVQHAHQKGIIHRDLKPSNVLVTMQDGDAVPKIIDFGIAKATGQQEGDDPATQFTEISQLVGTPLYMSPEQVENGGTNVDTRADVYALGVLLYELLTGRTPLDRERVRSMPREELARLICRETPPRPSSRLEGATDEAMAAARFRASDPRALCATVRGDLDWIVMRCLEKDRSRRYDTANALARDIDRHLRDQPVEASPPSRVYLLRKFVHRHRTALAASMAFVAVLMGATAASVWQAVRATRAEEATVIEKQRADDQSKIAIGELQRAVQVQQMIRHIILDAHPTAGSTGRDVSVVELLRNASKMVGEYLDKVPESEIEVREELADAFEELNELDDAAQNLGQAYKLACAGAGGEHSPTAVRVAAKLARYVPEAPTAERAFDDAKAMFGPNDPLTQRAAAGLAHVLSDQALMGIYRTDQLHRAIEIMKGLVAQLETLPPERRTSDLYEYLNELAVQLNNDHRYAQAESLIHDALLNGSRDRLLHDGTRASLGFSLVEALIGQGKIDQAFAWAQKSYEFDRATIGAFDHRSDRMLRTYIKLLGRLGRTEEANRLLNDTYAMARAFYPGDNPTVSEFVTTLAEYLLDQGQTEAAIPQLVKTARMEINTPGKLQNRARLMAREALLASLGSKKQPIDGGIRAQVFCALEDMWRDHSENMPTSFTAMPGAVSYRLWKLEGGGKMVLAGTLADPEPANPGAGMYQLTVEVRSPEVPTFSQSFGVLVADWDTVTYEDDDMRPVDFAKPPGGSSAKPVDHRQLPAIAETYLFKDTPQTFSPYIRTRGTTSVHLPAGRYRFVTSSADGMRLLVDGRVAIHSWSGHRPRRDIRELELDEGTHQLGFDTFQRGRRRLMWIRVEPVTAGNARPRLRSFERALIEQKEMDGPEGYGGSGTLLAQAGRYREALGEYAKAISMEPWREFWWQQSALISLRLEDEAGYRGAVERLLHEPVAGDDRVAAARAAVVALAPPEANVSAEVRERLKVADPDAAPDSQRGECLLATGIAAYREGRDADAIAVLKRAAEGRLTVEAKTTANAVRAMALFRAGDGAAARKLLSAGTRAMEGFAGATQGELDPMEVQDRVICQLMIGEAQEMIGDRKSQ